MNNHAQNSCHMKIALTWTPNPKLLGLDPYETYLNHLVSVISSLRRCCESFCVYPEFNKKGNMHYHGVLYVNNVKRYYREVIPLFKKQGYILEKKGNIDSKWDAYISKDVGIMRKALEPLPVPVTDQTYLFDGRYSKAKLMDCLIKSVKKVKEKRTIYDLLLDQEDVTDKDIETFRENHSV